MSTTTFGNIINSKLKSPITTEAVVSFPQKKNPKTNPNHKSSGLLTWIYGAFTYSWMLCDCDPVFHFAWNYCVFVFS